MLFWTNCFDLFCVSARRHRCVHDVGWKQVWHDRWKGKLLFSHRFHTVLLHLRLRVISNIIIHIYHCAFIYYRKCPLPKEQLWQDGSTSPFWRFPPRPGVWETLFSSWREKQRIKCRRCSGGFQWKYMEPTALPQLYSQQKVLQVHFQRAGATNSLLCTVSIFSMLFYLYYTCIRRNHPSSCILVPTSILYSQAFLTILDSFVMRHISRILRIRLCTLFKV